MESNISMYTLNQCAKCSNCTANCPVVRVNNDFPGPKALGADWLRLSLNKETYSQYPEGIDYCSNCKNCEIACPSGVPVASLNQLTKALKMKKEGFGIRERIFANPRLLGKFAVNFSSIVNTLSGIKFLRRIGEKLFRISASIPFPAYARSSFTSWYRGYKQKVEEKAKKVVYFPGCFTEYNKPEVGAALVRILNHFNYEVIVPEFKCCGQPAIGNGALDSAKEFAIFNLNQLQEYIDNGYPILFSCPSCLLTFKEEYSSVLEIKDAEKFVSHYYDACEFLTTLDLTEEEFQGKWLAGKYAYHEPCHLKASGIGTPGLELLNLISTEKIKSLEAGCCGLSGSYGLKAEKEPVALAIGQKLNHAVKKTAAEMLITECGMCGVQLNYISGLPVYHPLELLAQTIDNKITKKC